tara:strand:- start:561 stop:1544 length:984 start_codon:yes stop_codon:yes gene_type:complete
MNYRETIAAEILAWMDRDPKAIVMGVGVADNKGIFGTTKLAHDKYPDRVIETPLSENMLTGSLLGLAQEGFHPMLVHARSDFMTLSMEHLVNSLAKWKYMGGEQLNVTVRCIIGQGWGNGPQHTQSTAHWFASVPGLEVWMPTASSEIEMIYRDHFNPSIRIIYEHRRLYETNLPYQHSWGPGDEILILTTSASRIDVENAVKILREVNIAADSLSLIHYTQGDWYWADFLQDAPMRKPKAILAVDISPGGWGILTEPLLQAAEEGIKVGRISPPAIPVPASEAIEGSWYPGPEQIVNAALELIGKSGIRFNNNKQGENFKPEGSPF